MDTSSIPAGSGSVYLAWNPPDKNQDGSPLTDLAGYIVYFGPETGNYTNRVIVGAFNECFLDRLPVGETLFFTVTAYDTSGNESLFADEVSTLVTVN